MSYTDLTYEQVAEVISYDPDTGKFRWKERGAHLFPGQTASLAEVWNHRFADRPALFTKHRKGYRHGRVLGYTVFAHRVAWLLMTGAWPKGHVTHSNGDIKDNRWLNLLVSTENFLETA